MKTPHIESYLERTEWHRYQRFLPSKLRYSADTIPTEEWMRWENADVHIDRLARPEAKSSSRSLREPDTSPTRSLG